MLHIPYTVSVQGGSLVRVACIVEHQWMDACEHPATTSWVTLIVPTIMTQVVTAKQHFLPRVRSTTVLRISITERILIPAQEYWMFTLFQWFIQHLWQPPYIARGTRWLNAYTDSSNTLDSYHVIRYQLPNYSNACITSLDGVTG